MFRLQSSYSHIQWTFTRSSNSTPHVSFSGSH
jgi:hypothetical protein